MAATEHVWTLVVRAGQGGHIAGWTEQVPGTALEIRGEAAVTIDGAAVTAAATPRGDDGGERVLRAGGGDALGDVGEQGEGFGEVAACSPRPPDRIRSARTPLHACRLRAAVRIIAA